MASQQKSPPTDSGCDGNIDSQIDNSISSTARFGQTNLVQSSNTAKASCSNSYEELAHLFALRSINGVGPIGASNLLSHFGSASAVMTASDKELSVAGLRLKLIQALREVNYEQFDDTFEWLEKPNRSVVPIGSSLYPALLAQTATPPLFLFAIGDVEHLLTPQIAVVGSRSPTQHGITNTQHLCQQLVAEGLTVTSGLALGIDGEAHRTALANKGYTVAVTGTGLARVYPACHKKLAHMIADKGVMVSECFPHEGISSGSFPKRNRIIAGLSLGTLVVEAAKKSGSLITANIAMEESREVFAVPGYINNPLAAGCHWLIRQGAKLVENSKDIVEELPALVTAQRQSSATDTRTALTQEAADFLQHVDYETTSLDMIVLRTQLPLESVTNMLLLLELDGWVTNTTGGYMRI